MKASPKNVIWKTSLVCPVGENHHIAIHWTAGDSIRLSLLRLSIISNILTLSILNNWIIEFDSICISVKFPQFLVISHCISSYILSNILTSSADNSFNISIYAVAMSFQSKALDNNCAHFVCRSISDSRLAYSKSGSAIFKGGWNILLPSVKLFASKRRCCIFFHRSYFALSCSIHFLSRIHGIIKSTNLLRAL